MPSVNSTMPSLQTGSVSCMFRKVGGCGSTSPAPTFPSEGKTPHTSHKVTAVGFSGFPTGQRRNLLGCWLNERSVGRTEARDEFFAGLPAGCYRLAYHANGVPAESALCYVQAIRAAADIDRPAVRLARANELDTGLGGFCDLVVDQLDRAVADVLVSHRVSAASGRFGSVGRGYGMLAAASAAAGVRPAAVNLDHVSQGGQLNRCGGHVRFLAWAGVGPRGCISRRHIMRTLCQLNQIPELGHRGWSLATAEGPGWSQGWFVLL